MFITDEQTALSINPDAIQTAVELNLYLKQPILNGRYHNQVTNTRQNRAGVFTHLPLLYFLALREAEESPYRGCVLTSINDLSFIDQKLIKCAHDPEFTPLELVIVVVGSYKPP